VRIYRIGLRNYRIFEEQLDLELPSGLIGIYGANGAGKSYLIESIPWTLYGRTRTSVQDVRTSGSQEDCVSEIEFEHEDHLYRVRRSVSVRGLVKARAWIDNELGSDGVKETNRFIHATLGMDVDSFRASVFAEQKQLSAFSEANPADRQRLVLSLLGITPLDKARDMARADARAHLEQLKLARASLPEFSQLDSDRNECLRELEVVNAQLESNRTIVEQCKALAERESAEYSRLEATKIERDQVIVAGKEKRHLFDELTFQVNNANRSVTRLQQIDEEVARVSGATDKVAELEAKLAEMKASLDRLSDLSRASSELERLLQPFACRTVQELEELRTRVADQIVPAASDVESKLAEIRTLELEIASIGATCESANNVMEILLKLGGDSPCPTCGQDLGDGFEEHVRESRKVLDKQRAALKHLRKQLDQASQESEAAACLHRDLIREKESIDRIIPRASLLAVGIDESFLTSDVDKLKVQLSAVASELKIAKQDQTRYFALVAERRELEKQVDASTRVFESHRKVGHELRQLKIRLQGLDFDPERFSQQKIRRDDSVQRAKEASELFEREMIQKLQAEAKLGRVDALIAQAREIFLAVERLEKQSELVTRVAEYLNEFRRSTISALGPRLANSSAELFGELTESEYDRLEVDTSSWQLRISDFGVSHDLNRFSGSERDLANLAFRIAISEQIGRSFGQQVGLLVLDEIFGPLDDQRKFVMLGALDSLKARFNQVIVVTHGMEIKEQIPGAIEVLKLGSRRATARIA